VIFNTLYFSLSKQKMMERFVGVKLRSCVNNYCVLSLAYNVTMLFISLLFIAFKKTPTTSIPQNLRISIDIPKDHAAIGIKGQNLFSHERFR